MNTKVATLDRELVRKTVHAAQDQLSYLADWWKFLPEPVKPIALKNAIWNLTICWMDNRMQAEMRLGVVAGCMGIPVEELRERIEARVNFLSFATNMRDEKFKEVLCQLMTR